MGKVTVQLAPKQVGLDRLTPAGVGYLWRRPAGLAPPAQWAGKDYLRLVMVLSMLGCVIWFGVRPLAYWLAEDMEHTRAAQSDVAMSDTMDSSSSATAAITLAGFLCALALTCLAALAGCGGYGIFMGLIVFGAIAANASLLIPFFFGP